MSSKKHEIHPRSKAQGLLSLKDKMEKQKLLIVDVDDTILEFSEAFRVFFNDKYNKDVTGAPVNWGLEKWLDVEQADVSDILKAFMHSDSFMHLNSTEGATRVISRVKDNGAKVVAITACGTDPKIVFSRLHNLRLAFGDDIDKVFFTNQNKSKYRTLERLQKKYDVIGFIDDKVANVRDAIKAGIPSYLYSRPHNLKFTEHEDYTRVKSWDYFCDHLYCTRFYTNLINKNH